MKGATPVPSADIFYLPKNSEKRGTVGGFSILFPELDNFRRASDGNGEFGNVLRNNSVCADHGTVSYGHTSQNFSPCPNPHVVADSDWLDGCPLELYEVLPIRRMIRILNLHVGADQHIRPYRAGSFHGYDASTPDRHVVADAQRRVRLREEKHSASVEHAVASHDQLRAVSLADLKALTEGAPPITV